MILAHVIIYTRMLLMPVACSSQVQRYSVIFDKLLKRNIKLQCALGTYWDLCEI